MAESIYLWPNGDCCYESEALEYFVDRSDDYETIYFDDPRYASLAEQLA